MTTLRRLTSLMAVIAMLLTLTAIPAMAAAQASATITTGDLLSGQDGNVNLRITNDASGGTLGVVGRGSDIDAFVIEVPQDLVNVAAADVTLPEGWTGGYDDEIGFIFGQAEDGSELAPGDSLDVGIGVSALAIPDDRTRGFTTSVSDDGGMTLSSAGSPDVTTRILKIEHVYLTKLPTATNTNPLQVTAGQNAGTYFRMYVRNHGTEARSVTADVATDEEKSSSTGLATTPMTRTVDAGVRLWFGVGATLGSEGSLVVDFGASSANSEAASVEHDTIAVQEAFAANLVADSLQPTGVAQGTTTNIQYRINKTAGAQPVTGDATFSFGGFSATDGQSFDAANGEKTVLFEAVTIPDLANGDYETTSTIDGVDANGATVDLTVEPGLLTLDNLLPILEFTLDVGESDVKDTTPATTDGRPITYSGSIELTDDEGADGGLCDDCTITEAVLVAEPGGEELPMNVTNDDGTLSGSQSFTFPAKTTTAFARITVVRDLTGISADTVSNTVEVDLVIPGISNPGRTNRTDDRDQIIIDIGDDGEFLNAEGTRAVDWSVDNNTVTSVHVNPSRETGSQVILNLQNRLDDNATPAVSYNHTVFMKGASGIFDRVSHNMFDQTVDTIDGIVPDAPILQAVNGLGLQDGEFYINDSTPEVTLGGLDAGNVLEIYYDTNDDGAPQTEERVYNKAVDGSTETVTLADLGNVNQSHDLLARMKDAGGNIGPLDTEVLNLDFTAAEITDFTVDGQEVTVTFDEPVVRGRDASFDWTVVATQDGHTAHRSVSQVVEGADSTQRVLTISSTSYDSSAADAEVHGVRYKFRGTDPADRYEDRATNLFVDVLFTKE